MFNELLRKKRIPPLAPGRDLHGCQVNENHVTFFPSLNLLRWCFTAVGFRFHALLPPSGSRPDCDIFILQPSFFAIFLSHSALLPSTGGSQNNIRIMTAVWLFHCSSVQIRVLHTCFVVSACGKDIYNVCTLPPVHATLFLYSTAFQRKVLHCLLIYLFYSYIYRI